MASQTEPTLMESIIALQSELNVRHAMDVVTEQKQRMASSQRPLPTPNQIAKSLMEALKTVDGKPARWTMSKAGQKYAQPSRQQG